jgi:hypothetical protein
MLKRSLLAWICAALLIWDIGELIPLAGIAAMSPQNGVFFGSNFTVSGATPISNVGGYTAYTSTYGASVGPTPNINTSGATLLVCVAAYSYQSASGVTITDAKGNTWRYLTARNYGAFNTGYGQIAYSYDHAGSALSVGSGENFSATPPGTGQDALSCTAYSGTLTTSSVYVAATDIGGTGVTTCQPGSLTPASGNLFIESMSGNSNGATSLTLGTASLRITNVSNWDSGLGDYIAPNTSPINPQWTIDAANDYVSCNTAEFTHP